jgi:hypothetical protein
VLKRPEVVGKLMLYQLSYARVVVDSSRDGVCRFVQDFSTRGVFVDMSATRQDQRMSALWGSPKSGKTRH